MACQLFEGGGLVGKETIVAEFAKQFTSALVVEVDKGQKATDEDLVLFQKSINANVKTGAATRLRILEKKLLLWNPSFYDDAKVASFGASISEDIAKHAKVIATQISLINAAYSASNGVDFFKPTNKTVGALTRIGDPIASYEGFKNLIEDLYFVLWEGPGSKLMAKPDSFVDINTLRTEEEHDVDHGDASKIKKKKIEAGLRFFKYSGVTSPVACDPSRFPLFQRNILSAIVGDLKTMKDAGGA